MSWIKEIIDPESRDWEQFYKKRWSYDRMVRSTHGVNCTGSCSWNIYVKNGIVTWEFQALDYPKIDSEIPPYEPRGCQRGISYSSYLYSPIRVKYPYIRGPLLDAWKKAKKLHSNPLEAWKSIVENPEISKKIKQSRGKGGFRRSTWDESAEIIAAANLYTIERHGSDRIIGFSPIPAMSMVSYAAGARFMQLLGGVSMSFYDWYCDLPPASPEIWGEQTDVAESADWYHSKFIAVVGSNVFMTRTPDAHFLVEARHNGTKVVVFSPDLSMTSKAGDEWIPIHQGQDSAFWQAVGHVILREFYVEKPTPYFEEYITQYTDSPFLVKLERLPSGYFKSGAMLRISDCSDGSDIEHGEWKTCIFDGNSKSVKTPTGTIGHRWQKQKGKWNLKMSDGESGDEIKPLLSLLKDYDQIVEAEFPDFTEGTSGKFLNRQIPVKKLKGKSGDLYVTTVFDLLFAQYGVYRGLPGQELMDYGQNEPFTPTWQEIFSGVSAEVVIQFAREWATTALHTEGKCSVIIGAGVNHWYHNNLIYRSIISVLMMTGCVGKNGGGLNHYVGQEKLVPQASWGPIAFGTDWNAPPRQQNAPSFHYVHSDQWRYDKKFEDICSFADEKDHWTRGHTIDKNIQAVRNGWLPFYPQFTTKNQEVIRLAIESGAKTEEEIIQFVAQQLKEKKLQFAIENPDTPENFPRLFYIWRGNALMSSAKGHEYFLRHYLGTHDNIIAKEIDSELVKDAVWHDKVPVGKMDLVIDINFRMDTSALYSDIILPAATYYEKNDLNSTDMHSFIHPLQAAVPACWESKPDWDVFKTLAKATSEMATNTKFKPFKDLIATPIAHDTPGELSQPHLMDWYHGNHPAIPGKNLPNFKVVDRDISQVYNKFISVGPGVKNNGLGLHGIKYQVQDIHEAHLKKFPTVSWNDQTFISLMEDKLVCEFILAFAAETNGELAYRAFQVESEKTGIDLTWIAEKSRNIAYNFSDIIAAPSRVLTSPFWTGFTLPGRTYSAYCLNVEGLVPWRTLTGRQHFYLDHPAYVAYGEHLPTHKSVIEPHLYGDLDQTEKSPSSLELNYLTPHGKWGIHSTYGDLVKMKTLSRGIEPIWLNKDDANLLGIQDNDWVEVFNDNGVVCTRANVTHRIPRGMCFIYHSPERTLGVPKSPERGMKRAGGHNSLTRVRLKPLFMIGGYAQFTYAFNYWGPQGVNRETNVIIKKLNHPVY